ncbi:MAG: hypothetical protein M1586_01005 [Patescibacteria group bacterium]|nr:hypothetical protein [Patescibacteria group bacterium]MCL5261865.1 hypothetical protein [Patescibacteria group bacterium]
MDGSVATIVFFAARPDGIAVFTNGTLEALKELVADALRPLVKKQEEEGSDHSPVDTDVMFTVNLRRSLKDNSSEMKSNTGNRTVDCIILGDAFCFLTSGELAPQPLGATAG